MNANGSSRWTAFRPLLLNLSQRSFEYNLTAVSLPDFPSVVLENKLKAERDLETGS